MSIYNKYNDDITSDKRQIMTDIPRDNSPRQPYIRRQRIIAKPATIGIRHKINKEDIVTSKPDTTVLHPLQDNKIWLIGFIDGSRGQSQESGRNLVKEQAIQEWNETLEIKGNELARHKSELEKCKYVISELEEQKIKISSAYEHTATLSVSRRSAILQGGLFIVVSLVMLGADIPLTQSLIKEGFQMQDLVDWEVFLLTVGLVLTGILVKYYLDQNGEKKYTKVIIHLFMLLFILTVIVFGMYRSMVYEQTQKMNALPNAKRDSSALIQEQSSMSSVRGFAFILITLILPLSGGLCFYAGTRQCKIAFHIKQLDELSTKIDDQTTTLCKLTSTIEDKTRSYQKEREIIDSKIPLIPLYVSTYDHGYSQGAITPSNVLDGKDLYDHCENMLLKSVVGVV